MTNARPPVMSGAPAHLARCLGRISGSRGGPTLVITGGLHGNEPAGVLAALAVLRDLRSRKSVLRGEVIAFSGNRPALERGVRFVSRDLNRGWRSPELERLGATPREKLRAEDLEQHELHQAIRSLEREAARLVFLDLHTTSGPTVPFACFSDTAENRRFACALPVNVVLGLERSVHASMLTWASLRGHVGISFEAGQHLDPGACRRHVGAIWMLLIAIGAVDAADVPNEREHLAELTHRGGARVVEIRHRHVVEDDDDFEMLGGFKGFDPIEAGQIVARDRHGPIKSPEAGLMLMPRYQRQGEDGFFVAREIPCQTARTV